MTPALRALVLFWVGLAIAVAGTAAVLRFGAPQPMPIAALPASRQPDAASRRGAIAAPDPALEEPAAGYADSVVPRVGADGRTPMRAYAAASAPDDHRPRIAMLLTGVGLSAAEDEAAEDALPSAISFAVSPYAFRPDAMLQKMRNGGHESFLSLPMEPQNYPTEDPGPEALLTSNTEDVNQRHLQWAMSRIAGYVGVTNAMGTLHGERFAGSATQMAPVLRELGSRGLVYVDSRPGAPRAPGAIGRSADAVIDAASASTEADTELAQLEATARNNGSALGVVGPPNPALVARLARWAAALPAHGLTLVPVSAVASGEPSMTQAATDKP